MDTMRRICNRNGSRVCMPLFFPNPGVILDKQLRLGCYRLFSGPANVTLPAKSSKKDKIMSPSNSEHEMVVITPRKTDYAAWYGNVIAASDMIDASPVRGCMVIKPWGMGVWDIIRADLDVRIRNSGAQNAYFPLFIPMSFLSKEAQHVEGFAKECAVVTHHRLCQNKDGDGLMPDPSAVLEEPLVVRPTSETLIWHMFAKWIQSHRDLPLKINQWANVVRWEMRTRPFLRTSEFLWQEGHTAHASREEAVQTARDALDMYAELCENLLAIPCIKGEKSPSERFAGADITYTIEAMMQNGWALQAGTSHFLGQNFAKAFDVQYDTAAEDATKAHVWATSWGVSTRLIGATIMTHSDDKGLVLPPHVAPVQVVIVPIVKTDGDNSATMERVHAVEAQLKKAGIRVKVDDRLHMRPGAKYFEWERKGLPLRLDIGPRDVANNTAVLAQRHSGTKSSVSCSSDDNFSGFVTTISTALSDMHSALLTQATERLAQNTHKIDSYKEMVAALGKTTGTAAALTVDTERSNDNSHSQSNNQHYSNESNNNESSGKIPGFFLAPWKCDALNEAAIKKECSATIRCYPLDMNKSLPENGVKCFYSGEQATHYAIFAKAY